MELLEVSVKLRRCPLSAWSQDSEAMAFAADLAETQRAFRGAEPDGTPPFCARPRQTSDVSVADYLAGGSGSDPAGGTPRTGEIVGKFRADFAPDTGDPMHTAEVRIAADDDFGARLKDMRLWLDEHRFEPSTFTYFYLNPGMNIQVSFKIGDEAQAFAQQFGGSLK
jgi:hypothetical protein